ncbi:MAG: hypothetical protein ABI875_03920 [Gemmatimonadales bacterium]
MTGFTVRAASESDLGAALSLVEAARAEVYGLDRIPEILEDAARGSAEYRASVAEHNGQCVGVGVYGLIAGTVDTATIYAVIVAKGADQYQTGRAILNEILSGLASVGTRLVVAEFPGHSCLTGYRALLEATGFIEESSVEDYFEDGIPLLQYRFEITKKVSLCAVMKRPGISGTV